MLELILFGRTAVLAGLTALALMPAAVAAGDLCTGFGPQTPRDIAQKSGANTRTFSLAPQPWAMNLCNIHTHTYAEHKGPGFSLPGSDGHAGMTPTVHVTRVASTPAAHDAPAGHDAAPAGGHDIPAGWRCNETATLSDAERQDPWGGHGPFGNVKPGDTIEVHWVFTSCDVTPGKGLGACSSPSCTNPQLRVESQVFLVVNDPSAASFSAFDYAGTMRNGFHQPMSLPQGSGEPVVFAGSTTGPSYDDSTCSPFQVTWSVRPYCMRLNLMSLHAWAAAGNVFEESHSHGVRPLVTAPDLLAPIP